MESIVSHLVAFLVGTGIGAAGTYFAEKYTDVRRKKESGNETMARFRKLESLMPLLFAEIRKDIEEDKSNLIREAVILPTPTVGFNGDKIRFAYHESVHDSLLEKFHHIERAGFAIDISPGRTPIYRFTDEFVDLIKIR